MLPRPNIRACFAKIKKPMPATKIFMVQTLAHLQRRATSRVLCQLLQMPPLLWRSFTINQAQNGILMLYAFLQCSQRACKSDSANQDQEGYSEPEFKRDKKRSSVELPSIRDQFRQDGLSSFQSPRPRELLPSILSHSPPNRFNSLPPIQRRDKLQRPRKPSVGQHARKAKHERTKSKEFGRRLSIEGRKAMSAEPPTAAWVQGKRWEDLIEAATSATEADDDRDLTPVCASCSPVCASLRIELNIWVVEFLGSSLTNLGADNRSLRRPISMLQQPLRMLEIARDHPYLQD